MTTKTKTTKTPKTTSKITNKIKVEKATSTKAIVESYKALTSESRHLELAFILEVATELTANRITVRSVQASIKEAIEQSGNAPTIRPAHAQYFVTLSKIAESIADADTYSVSALLKLAQRVGTSNGVENIQSAIDRAESIADLDTQTPTLAEVRADKPTKAKAETSAKPLATVESIFAQTLASVQSLVKGKNIRDVKTSDLKTLETLSVILAEIAKNSRPAKAKANA